MKRTWMLLGWFFFVYNTGGEPAWKIGEFTTSAACEASRQWVISAQAAKANALNIPPGPCFLQQAIQQ